MVTYIQTGRMASPSHIIAKKRDKLELSKDDINSWIKGVISNEVTHTQIGAWLMACVLNGMSSDEIAHLTMAMLKSGQIFTWPKTWFPSVVDKHSTGGVGDKVSLVLAPALAACGRKVPMISGRGLGITGGTLDKLESIRGFNVHQTPDDMKKALEDVGCCIVGQTANLAPADKVRTYIIGRINTKC